MPAVKSSLVHPRYKTEYRVRNWRQYEQGLRSRGDVTIWFSDEADRELDREISRSARRTTAVFGPRDRDVAHTEDRVRAATSTN